MSLCVKCTKPVYFAEKLVALGHDWHKTCFTCTNEACNKRLNAGEQLEHDKKPFCKSCYGKFFGPKGFRSGGADQPNCFVHTPGMPGNW
ncbi:cysteine-rich protein 1-like [Diadema setosum]|uniref:cysteine-rich protein 1-like n=1 Tax=Diadema setosum TaxID=31175 RepID=UPI003B3AF4D0